MLPKSKKWRSIVEEIANFDGEPEQFISLSNNTLRALGGRYQDLASDENVRTAFSFLVELARSVHRNSRDEEIKLAKRTPLELSRELSRRLTLGVVSPESRELAQRAAIDALVHWQRDQSLPQGELFGAQEQQVFQWQKLSSGAGFCELSRLFFARFTERYLNYFLDREASIALPDLRTREQFRKGLHAHIDDISRHSFETAKITQSFAAGWFNKHVPKGMPTRGQIKRFLAYAFAKLREDFQREVTTR